MTEEMATILQARPPSGAEGGAAGPTPASTSLVGQTLGSYTVIRELGQGGMGCVYLAEHALIGRKAAIKVLNPDTASDPEAVSRFFIEARAVNDIRHPNIVEVTDFGQFGPHHCIVMEYLEGETLAARLSRIRVFDEPSVIRAMKQCTSALSAAHDQSLVHRDIKPENIFLRSHPDYPDFVKLLDFGIAKLLGNDSTVGHHTKTGSVLGTPSYMSPEQCLGEAALDIRSDVYSLGIVIYQMLTGQLPFTGDTLGRLIVCHVNESPVPPSVINPDISRGMNDLVLRALQKKPKDRFQSARDMREALDRLLPPALRTLTPAFGVRVGAPNAPGILAPPALGNRISGAGSASGGAAVPNTGNPTLTEARGQAPREGGAISVPPPSGALVGPAADLTRRLTSIMDGRIDSGTIDLPDMPAASIRCIDLGRQGKLGFTEAAMILNDVPMLRSRVMKLANSAAFPSLMPAPTIEQAVARLGSDGLTIALVEFATREALEGKHGRVRDLMRRIWPHALGVATMTQDLAQTLGVGHPSDGYLVGLLRQVGKPAVGSLLVDIEQQMIRAGKRSTIPDAVFIATMEACHARVGAAVARHWDLSEAVAAAVESSRQWNPHQPYTLGNVVRLAEIMVNRLGLTVGVGLNGPELERRFHEGRALLRLDELALRRFSHGFKERIVVLAGIRG
jgi:HD-like signal output (HDOD) protein